MSRKQGKKHKKRIPKKNRLHKDVVEALRRKGGHHSTQKGAKGYDRRRDRKQKIRSQTGSSHEPSFFFIKKLPIIRE